LPSRCSEESFDNLSMASDAGVVDCVRTLHAAACAAGELSFLRVKEWAYAGAFFQLD